MLDLYYKVAIFELELRRCTSRTRLVLQSCDFRAGAAAGGVLRALSVLDLYCDFRAGAAAGVLRVLDLCYEVAIFELELRKCTSRTAWH